ncbi:tRNA sulfurtransferase [Halomicrobium salinisoli]|uniref:tRNA sulfurtransferase n=1 Tax=Halomicrobium salinisoli TaxID=2878391 RepID=UPI001CF0AF43|nr:tRNA sulfurtransferase [Halomicrobium salinisoli]
MQPPGADVVLVRHGELGIKSDQVRRKMEGRLADNLAALLAHRGVDGEIERKRTRLYVHTDEPDRAADAAADAFGVVSASPALTVEPTLPAIEDALARTAEACWQGGPFAVRARRAGQKDAHDFSSRDLEQEGGSAVWEAIESAGGEPEVDLDDPAFTVHVECREDRAYVFTEKREGPGGLPVGTQYPVAVLISGGIDSPVAAWRLMRRGCPIRPVYVDLGDYGGPDHRARAVATVEDLAAHAPNMDVDVRVVPGGDDVADLAEELDRTRMLSLRRYMFAAAEAVVEATDAVGIATGEAIGQKSSQTSANLAATDTAVDCPVHRPNLSANKSEITQQAREIGTFEESTIPTGCNRVAPSFPETNADPETVRELEPDDLLERAREAARDADIVPVDP